MTDEGFDDDFRVTPERKLTLNLSAEEREDVASALTVAIDEAERLDEPEKAERLRNVLGKVVQEGGKSIN